MNLKRPDLSRRRMPLSLLAVVVVVCLPGLQAESLGRVGTLEVSLEDLRSTVEALDAGQVEAMRKEPALVEQLVRSFLVQRLILKEATDHAWQDQPAVRAKLARVRESTLTESYLESVAQPPADYPSDEEIRTAYDTHREALQQPRSFRLAQIFIAQGEGGDTKLKEVQALLKEPKADFAALAQKHSQEAESAARGGEIGWVTEAQIEPALRNHVTGLKLHETTAPIELKDGWHILRLLDGRAPFVPTIEQVRPQLIKQLRQARLSANTQAYLARLLKEHPLVLNESTLSRVLPSPAR